MRTWVVAAVAAAVVVTGAGAASAADLVAGTTVVTPERSSQFAGTYDRGAGTREFTDRLGAPPGGGTGALVLSTPSGDDKVQFVTGELSGPLATFGDTTYWTRRDPASTSGALPSFQIAVDIDGGTLAPRDLHLLTFVPSGGGDGWTRQDAGAGRWCVTRQDGGLDAYRAGCADGDRRTIGEIVREHPGVTALAAGVNQGGGDGGLVAAVDLVHVGTTTYDVEPAAR